MADKFDPYREALVVETTTVWTPECDHLSGSEKSSTAAKLHGAPAKCSKLAYIRVHTGFCREITVTEDDLKRLQTE